MMELTVKVDAITRQTQDIRSYELVDPEGRPLPMFTAGSHVDVRVPNGCTRQYSLCNDPREVDRYVIAVLREAAGRGGSDSMHDDVKEGNLLTIGVPRNNFPLSRDARHHVLLAGGIGVTPLLAMARELAARNASFELHYCTRTPDRTAFMSDLSQAAFRDRVRCHHDNGVPADGLDLAALLRPVRDGAHVYCCGPTGFMRACEDAAAHWPRGRVHFEFFTADPDAEHDADAAFRVKLASSGRILDVPADRSIVEVLRANGVEVETMCEEGICGTCATVLLEGEPDHRDFVLDDDERARGEFIMVCCSRAKTAMLTLDL